MISAMRNAGLGPAGELEISYTGKMLRYTISGDKPKSKAGWYVGYDDCGDFRAGRFGSWKTGDNIVWCSKSKSEFSPEERKAYAAKMAAAQREREKVQAEVYERCRSESTEKWAKAAPADEKHPYLTLKGVNSFGLRASGEALMVPVWAKKGILAGIQYIFPDGRKMFKTGTEKKGSYCSIGKPVDNTVIICEGYATGASIHQATGHAVMVAFDAGNLKPVAEKLRNANPTATIIIAGDNDRWAKEAKEDGTTVYHDVPCTLNGSKRENSGHVAAVQAAKAVRGEYRVPSFNNLASHPTDFNDLFNMEGAEAVKKQIFPPPMADYEPPPIDDDYEPPPIDLNEYTEHPLTNAPFQPLGYNHGEYYYLPKGAPQVKSLTADKHTSAHLLSMAPLNWWKQHFPGKSCFDATAAANMLIRAQEKTGVYDNRRIRGRGAWEDKGRTVLHLGNRLIVDGAEKPLSEHKSHWIYESGSPLEMDGVKSTPMVNEDAHKLLELCKMFSWDKPIYAEFLAGWMVIAPICGVLPWRPHILITGAAGSGKSTVSDTVVRSVVGPSAIACMGNTTEAGLRGEAGSDARAVLFDEAESGGENSKRMQAVIELARQSSSDIGYAILKGSQSGKSVKYLPRLCFCFSSIGSAATQQADNERITALSLVKDERPGHNERYDEIKKTISSLLTNEYCQSLRARQYSLIPTILSNYKIFSRLLAIKFSSQRAGDQYGAFLSGSYSLRSRNLIDDVTAQKLIDTLDWSESITDTSSRDESQCLGVILQHQIQVAPTERLTIGELLEIAILRMDSRCDSARATLLRHGIKVNEPGDGFSIANKHTSLGKILEKTPWSQDWGHILARVKGALKTKPQNFTAGAYSRAVLLPMTILDEGSE